MPDVRLLTPLVRLLVAGLLVRLLVSLWVDRRRHRSVLYLSDRYAIRTRNLQDWNLTRCRCANRSEGKHTRTPPRYDSRATWGRVPASAARGAALRSLLLPRRKEVVCNVNRPTLRSVTAYKCSFYNFSRRQ